jgi:hypothetical protein
LVQTYSAGSNSATQNVEVGQCNGFLEGIVTHNNALSDISIPDVDKECLEKCTLQINCSDCTPTLEFNAERSFRKKKPTERSNDFLWI